MAEFCNVCSREMDAPEGWTDFKGLDGMFLCEGCGVIEVEDGKRVRIIKSVEEVAG